MRLEGKFFWRVQDFLQENSGFPGGSMIKNLPTSARATGQSLGQEDLLEKEVATHSSILAWRIPWTQEPVRLQSMGSRRVRYSNWTTTRSHLGDEQILLCPSFLPAIYKTQSKLKLHRRRGNETWRKILQGEFKTMYRKSCLEKIWKSAGSKSILQGGVCRKTASHAVSRTLCACVEGLLSGDAALKECLLEKVVCVPWRHRGPVSAETVGGNCRLVITMPAAPPLGTHTGPSLQTWPRCMPHLLTNPLTFRIPVVSPGVMFC